MQNKYCKINSKDLNYRYWLLVITGYYLELLQLYLDRWRLKLINKHNFPKQLPYPTESGNYSSLLQKTTQLCYFFMKTETAMYKVHVSEYEPTCRL